MARFDLAGNPHPGTRRRPAAGRPAAPPGPAPFLGNAAPPTLPPIPAPGAVSRAPRAAARSGPGSRPGRSRRAALGAGHPDARRGPGDARPEGARLRRPHRHVRRPHHRYLRRRRHPARPGPRAGLVHALHVHRRAASPVTPRPAGSSATTRATHISSARRSGFTSRASPCLPTQWRQRRHLRQRRARRAVGGRPGRTGQGDARRRVRRRPLAGAGDAAAGDQDGRRRA